MRAPPSPAPGSPLAACGPLAWLVASALLGCGGSEPVAVGRIADVTAAAVPEGWLPATRATAVDHPGHGLVLVSFDEQMPCIKAEMTFCDGAADGGLALGATHLECGLPASVDGAAHRRLDVWTTCPGEQVARPWVVASGKMRLERNADELRASVEARLAGEGSFDLMVDARFSAEDVEEAD